MSNIEIIVCLVLLFMASIVQAIETAVRKSGLTWVVLLELAGLFMAIPSLILVSLGEGADTTPDAKSEERTPTSTNAEAGRRMA